ncbi:MAG: membrane protein insertion efficiency factor YidD [Fibrobacterota bacterium]
MFFKRLLGHTVFLFVRLVKVLFQLHDGTCRYRPTCSVYTRDALVHLPLHTAVIKIIKRVASCRPGGGSGYDPPVEKNRGNHER